MRITVPSLIPPLALLCGAASAAPQAPAAQGLTVVRDAETGLLRAPTPLELRALRRQPPTTPSRPAPLAEVIGAHGERSIELGERGLVYSVIQRGAGGTSTTQQCVDGAHAAAQVLQPAAPAAGAPRHDHR